MSRTVFSIAFWFIFFFFNDTATTEIYTLSLHDALPICVRGEAQHEIGADVTDVVAPARDIGPMAAVAVGGAEPHADPGIPDRKSTRLNSSHGYISYAVFCLKKKKKIE